MYEYDFVNILSNSIQSGGVTFFVRACHSYEVVEGVSFEQSDVDGLWISNKLENNKSFIVAGLQLVFS